MLCTCSSTHLCIVYFNPVCLHFRLLSALQETCTKQGNCYKVSLPFFECQTWSEPMLSTEGEPECWVHVYWTKRYAACLKHKKEHRVMNHFKFIVCHHQIGLMTGFDGWACQRGKNSTNLFELRWIRRGKILYSLQDTSLLKISVHINRCKSNEFCQITA